MTPVVVPVHLGCCREGPTCLLCAPAAELPTPELVDALIHRYRTDHAEEGRELRVAFFGGALPSDELLEAIGDLPFTVRVRPDLLSRADAQALGARACQGVELDAWTLHDEALVAVGRRYAGRRVEEQLAGLPSFGLSPGIVLAPGLPGTRHQDAVDDARRATSARFARVHPVLVVEGSGLQAHALDGTYVPLTLGQAVSTAREVVDVLEGAGVEVVRVGANPLPDGLGRPVAGPFHPSFRQLVDARRVLDRLRGRLAGTCAGSSIVVRCHPADETITRGPLNQHVRTLRAAFRLAEVRIRPDEALARGELAIDIEEVA